MKYMLIAIAMFATPVSAAQDQLSNNLSVCKITGDLIYKFGQMRDSGISKSEINTAIIAQSDNAAIKELLSKWLDEIYNKPNVTKEQFWGGFTSQCLIAASQ